MSAAAIFVVLFQVAAGAPATPPPPPPPDATAPAQPSASPADENVVVEAPDQDRVRCRRAEPGVGTIIPRRICSTPRQDRERAERDQRELDTFQRRQTGVCLPTPNAPERCQ